MQLTSRLIRLFFELIQIALNRKQQFSQPIENHDWLFLFTEARQQALTGVLFPAVERLPPSQRPPQQLIRKWFVLAEQIQQTNRMIHAEIAVLQQKLQEFHLDYTLLKGQGLAILYPKPLLRIPGDIDVWVRPHNDRHTSLTVWRKELYRLVSLQGFSCQQSYHHLHISTTGVTDIELHLTPSWQNNPLLNRKLQKYFLQTFHNQTQHQVHPPESSCTFPTPTPEFNAFYLLLHIYHHLYAQGIGLRQLMDYYYVLHREWSADSRQNIQRILKEQQLEKFAGAVMYVMHTVFGLEPQYWLTAADRHNGTFLLKEILRSGNFGQYDSRNSHADTPNDIKRFIRSLKHLFIFAGKSPMELFWNPCFRIYYYLQRHKRT